MLLNFFVKNKYYKRQNESTFASCTNKKEITRKPLPCSNNTGIFFGQESLREIKDGVLAKLTLLPEKMWIKVQTEVT